jgi:glycosyltransferase involved in cell wall biosynthesis
VRVLVCEPYFGGSHQAWAEGYLAASSHEVTLVSHPATFWKWRMQGAALTLARRIAADATQHGPPDVLLVSDMVHVPALLGMARRHLGDAAVAVYFHENQLTYPWPEGETPDLTYGMTNWLSAASADLVLFNSEYHRQVFFAALPQLLRAFPDQTHTRDIDEVAARSEVLPVGIDDGFVDASRLADASAAPLVLWNQRWEYDKAPARFFAALYRLADEGVSFRVALAGENFRNHPVEFDEGIRRLAERVVHHGWLERRAYTELLLSTDVVVSTARHEFFGVAVAEAIAAGAYPVVPAALSYPEVVPGAHHDACLFENDDGLVDRLRVALTDPARRGAVTATARPAMRRLGWREVAPQYDDHLAALAEKVGLNGRTPSTTEAQ